MAVFRWPHAWSGESTAGPMLPRSAFGFDGTPGDDRIRATGSNDYIDVSQGGDDLVHARGGDDTIYFGAAFTGADYADGGKGIDTVILDGDYSAGVEFQADSLFKVEQLVLEGGSYVITGELDIAFGSAGAFVDGRALTADQSLHLEVSTPDKLTALGGDGDDLIYGATNGSASALIGSDGNDTLVGRGGATLFEGGAGADRIALASSGDIALYGALDSVRESYDTIENFPASGARIELSFDSNTDTAGVEYDFHFGKTPDRVGDIAVKYNATIDETVIKVFTDHDKTADCVIHLTGDVPLTPADFIFG